MSARIAINGRFLDEVQIRLSGNAASYVSYPAHRHEARLDGDRLLLAIPAPAVVQLCYEGVPLLDRGRPVAIRVGESDVGEFVLEGIELPDRLVAELPIVLRMRRHSKRAIG